MLTNSSELLELFMVTSRELPKKSSGRPGAYRMTTMAEIHAMIRYVIVVMIMAKNVPFGMAFCGSCE